MSINFSPKESPIYADLVGFITADNINVHSSLFYKAIQALENGDIARCLQYSDLYFMRCFADKNVDAAILEVIKNKMQRLILSEVERVVRGVLSDN